MSDKVKTMNDVAFEFLNEKFKVGDKVRVTMRVDSGVQGNRIDWLEGMEEALNSGLHTILDTNESYGAFRLSCGYWFPALAISSDVGKVTVKLPDYTAEITKEKVNVGCQVLTKEMILSIVKAAVDTGFLNEEDIASLKG